MEDKYFEIGVLDRSDSSFKLIKTTVSKHKHQSWEEAIERYLYEEECYVKGDITYITGEYEGSIEVKPFQEDLSLIKSTVIAFIDLIEGLIDTSDVLYATSINNFKRLLKL